MLDNLGHMERDTAGRVKPAAELTELEQSQAFHLRQSYQQTGQDGQPRFNYKSNLKTACQELKIRMNFSYLTFIVGVSEEFNHGSQ